MIYIGWLISLCSRIIAIMFVVELESFKTKKCELLHTVKPLSGLRLDCPHYHSRQDKRRNPFGGSGKNFLLYSDVYVEDYYSTQMASNLVQYLFHPNVYKTKLCKYRFKDCLERGQEIDECRLPCCPYIHEGEDLSYLQPVRNLPLSAPLEDNYIQKMEACLTLAGLFKKNLIGDNFRQNIDKFKLRLKEVAKQTEELIDTQQKAFAASATVQEKPPQICKAAQMKEQPNWYHEYQYFHFGERLPIIEDRHHEFKNYRDIVYKDIAPIVVKYIAAFLNSDGGVLYVGVDDSSVVYGFQMTQHEFDRFLLNVDAEGKRTLLPPLLPHKYSIRRIPVYNNKKGKELWVVEIKVTPSEKHKKEKVLTTYNREIFIRMNASTQKLDAVDLIEYIRYHHQQKQDERKPLEIMEQLTKNLQKQNKVPTQHELMELREKLTKTVEKVDQLSKNTGKN